MKTIFDKATREALINRVELIPENSQPVWGTMNTWQMLKHCTVCEEMYLGKTHYKRSFLGLVFGRIGLRQLMKDDAPLQRNLNTSKVFRVTAPTGDVYAEKKKWISLLEEYAQFSNDGLVHWFFGKMTTEEVGHFVYKHADHHLRQFNC